MDTVGDCLRIKYKQWIIPKGNNQKITTIPKYRKNPHVSII